MSRSGTTAAVIVAAGRGVRCGEGRRKQFRELGGVPVVERACAPFRRCDGVDSVVLVVPEDVLEDPPGWLEAAADQLVAGGESRQDSVRRGLAAVSPEATTILVHDGVRPLVSPELIERVLRAARQGAVVPVLPMVDTIKEIDEHGRVVSTLPRGRLRRVQTPQGFPSEILREAHRGAAREGRIATDDAALCEAAGRSVRTVRGEPENVKLTTREDFAYARWLLDRRGSREG